MNKRAWVLGFFASFHLISINSLKANSLEEEKTLNSNEFLALIKNESSSEDIKFTYLIKENDSKSIQHKVIILASKKGSDKISNLLKKNKDNIDYMNEWVSKESKTFRKGLQKIRLIGNNVKKNWKQIVATTAIGVVAGFTISRASMLGKLIVGLPAVIGIGGALYKFIVSEDNPSKIKTYNNFVFDSYKNYLKKIAYKKNAESEKKPHFTVLFLNDDAETLVPFGDLLVLQGYTVASN